MVTTFVESGTAWRDTADAVLDGLGALRRFHAPLPVDQLTHALLTATLAQRDGADDDLVVAALCHDLGKLLAPDAHGAVSAAVLQSHLRCDVVAVVRHHEEFRWAQAPAALGLDATARQRYRNEPWWDVAVRFSDVWDAGALDPAAEPRSLSYFTPVVRRVLR